MLKEWLRKKISGKDAVLVIGPEEESLSGLNLKEVMEVHEAWKIKLEDQLSGKSDEILDVEAIASDKNCTLGKWLYGPGWQKYSTLPEHDSCRKAHAAFHVTASNVVKEHQTGNDDRAMQLLKSEFKSASSYNQLELVRLFTAAKDK